MTLLTDNIEHNGKRKPNEEEFCRDVEAKFTLYVGQEFLEIEEAATFYRIYVVACGFDVRKYTTKRWCGREIKSQLLVCNREGFKHKGQLECSGRQDSGRRHKVRRVGCKARIRLFMRNGELRIDRFHSGHNHEFVSARDREFQKLACNITDYHKMIILYNSRVSILGFLKLAFAFLNLQYWSFDPTYSTNKYDMSFTPFTGVDNHKRSVTFCGALVAHEDADSFKWVFTRFLAAMGGKEPKYIITDQDAGILKAVPLVFKTARHRYCMWHIMNKVPSKFGMTRDDYSDFLKKLNAIIWDEDIEAADAMDQQRHTQKQIDNCNRHTFPVISTHLAIEVHGAQVYSHKVFEEFQEEAKCSIGTCKSRGFIECESLEVTTVRDANKDRNYEVTYCPGIIL
ncbi:protein FAR1-RELATED SEQUENCE 5-like [Silene latifolia]|uniref:protein FAR1-RELATED SEQUENCE 5-like n=1 Tax=Silene latifolia TaxID=37657 RepID=UPI003D770AFD